MAISCQATALEIAHWLGGQLHGEDQLVIELVPLSHNAAGTLSFATHVPIHLKASGVLLVREAVDGLNCITVPHPKWAMGELIRRFRPPLVQVSLPWLIFTLRWLTPLRSKLGLSLVRCTVGHSE